MIENFIILSLFNLIFNYCNKCFCKFYPKNAYYCFFSLDLLTHLNGNVGEYLNVFLNLKIYMKSDSIFIFIIN